MKKNVLRCICACLLMGIALALTAAVVSGTLAPEEELPEPTCIWTSITLQTELSNQTVQLFNQEGIPVETLQTETTGEAKTDLLEAGTYYVFTEHGCCTFSLTETGDLQVISGCGQADGIRLYLQATGIGNLQILTTAKDGNNNGWYDFSLSDGNRCRREVLRCFTVGTPLKAEFCAVPFGSYTLFLNGVPQTTVTLTADNPKVSLSLP